MSVFYIYLICTIIIQFFFTLLNIYFWCIKNICHISSTIDIFHMYILLGSYPYFLINQSYVETIQQKIAKKRGKITHDNGYLALSLGPYNQFQGFKINLMRTWLSSLILWRNYSVRTPGVRRPIRKCHITQNTVVPVLGTERKSNVTHFDWSSDSVRGRHRIFFLFFAMVAYLLVSVK